MPFRGCRCHADVFRQKFGGLRAMEAGMITVGVVRARSGRWKVAYASSSLTADTSLAGRVVLTPQAAWLKAAADIGHAASVMDVRNTKVDRAWSVFAVRGLAELQRARPVAVPTPVNGVRPALETLFIDNNPAQPRAYVHYVDAETGAVLIRKNLVFQSHPSAAGFTGSVTGPDASCDVDKGPWVVAPGENVRSIAVTVEAALTTNDAVINLKRDGTAVASADTLFSPEFLVYSPPGGVPAGAYTVQVCDFTDGHAWDPPQSYSGQVVFSAAAAAEPYPPKWKVFPGNPPLSALNAYPWNNPDTDTRRVWCWETATGNPASPTPVPGCERAVANLASRGPWDYNFRTNTPTFTTVGNNANAAEAWSSPLTPGATMQRPVSTTREYVYPWTNAWFKNGGNPSPPDAPRGCATQNLVPGGNDIAAAVTNLFAMHNRMHDWAYFLGFTERTWNAQDVNFGVGGTADRDPLQGDAQAGALSGGSPSYLGRDNANMISLPDGVPPITNMYLWQSLAGAFYAPCVDGDYDMAVIGHEYGHLIEVRQIGKGASRSGHHTGAMGESHSDLMAVEYLNEHGFVTPDTENPFSVGAYVTGNDVRAIRNYGMNFDRAGTFPAPGLAPLVNPFQFGDIGYDITGPQSHADGEIWSATNFDIREALVAKYNGDFPASDANLQRRCAEGELTADRCPGNRRWMQLVFDSYILMPHDASMLQARDAQLAADSLRFGAANQAELWLAFARRGFGVNAFSTNGPGNPPAPGRVGENDLDPRPDFHSPWHKPATVTFRAVASDERNAPIRARIYVGHYEGRVSPIADTDPATSAPPPGGNNLDDVAQFAPGTYEFVANAPGYGHLRLRAVFRANSKRTITFEFPSNWASAAKGAVAAGDGVRHAELIDDTEGTNWERTGASPDVRGSQVTVNLAGGSHTVNRVQVSAMLGVGQNRFTALRQFEILTCDEGANSANPTCAGTNPQGFTSIYTSPANAFPGDAPRPVAPQLILRSFAIPETVPLEARKATHVQIRVLTNQCTGQPQFQGEQDNDPLNATDCRTGSSPNPGFPADPPDVLAPRHRDVRIAELQVFTTGTGIAGVRDPVVLLTKTGPLSAAPGATVTYELAYSNAGPFAAANARIVDSLPAGVTFVSASDGGRYDADARKVTWTVGRVNAGASGARTVTVRVSAGIGSALVNNATFVAPETVSPPATWTTLVLP